MTDGARSPGNLVQNLDSLFESAKEVSNFRGPTPLIRSEIGPGKFQALKKTLAPSPLTPAVQARRCSEGKHQKIPELSNRAAKGLLLFLFLRLFLFLCPLLLGLFLLDRFFFGGLFLGRNRLQ